MEAYQYSKLKKDLGELKDKLKKAIAGEKEAKWLYREIVDLAMRSGQNDTGNKMKTIISQQSQHAETIWKLMKNTEEAEAGLQREYYEESVKRQREKAMRGKR